MNKKLTSIIIIALFFSLVAVIPQVSYCQTPEETIEPTPTEEAQQASGPDFLLIGGIAAAVAVIVVVALLFVVKRRSVNEKSLRKFSSRAFEDWVIKKFDGKPSDPSSGVNGFTQGGQPLLIIQSDHVSLPEVEDFVKVLAKGKAQKGTIVAFNFDKDTFEGKVTAMDNGIELQLLRVSELVNKRFARQLDSIARAQVTFDADAAYIPPEVGAIDTQTYTQQPFEKTADAPLNFVKQTSQNNGLKPRIFISNSNTKVAEQVKRMLDFIHYDYVMGDREEATVPIPEAKFGVMNECDCAIINIAAAEQERRYSGLYILNPNVISEINAAYLKYNTQVILLVERKVDLPANFKGLKRIEYDSDDLSFNAAMDLNNVLADFRKL
jgi:hypothetical protein